MDALDREFNKLSNPFTPDFLKHEIEWYGIKEFERDGVCIKTRQMVGRCDDYLNKNFRTGDVEFPALFVDGRLLMSLTYMEIQSSFLPILFASGECATAGLGMGYVPLQWAAKDEVDSIDVYEIDERIIKFFIDHFSDRPGFKKMKFIHGDVRKLMVEKNYDFVFMDPYTNLLDEEIIPDFKLFAGTCCIGDYHFWGQEKVLLSAILDFDKHIYLNSFEQLYFKMWNETKDSQMYQSLHDEDFIDEVIELMGR